MIYLDQAASTFPKPPEVPSAVAEAITSYGANPGRGSHVLARKAASVVEETRQRLSQFFGSTDQNKVLFTSSATSAINLALKGYPLSEGDHIISTTFEHNAVRRPLEAIRQDKGVNVTYINPLEEGVCDEIKRSLQSNTKLLVINHASNLTGHILPLDDLIKEAKKRDIKVLIDASQTAGVLPINMKKQSIDMLAIPGHKGLLGPQGIGALIIEGDVNLQPQIHGGTGGFHSQSIEQPDIWPDKYESGTLNVPGIAGLNAALKVLEKWGLNEIVSRETLLTTHCLSGLSQIDGIKVYGPNSKEERIGVVAFNVSDIFSQEVAIILDQHYNIAVRGGLHCTPLSHETNKTLDEGGAVRVSFGPYNTLEEVDFFLKAIKEIIEGFQGEM